MFRYVLCISPILQAATEIQRSTKTVRNCTLVMAYASDTFGEWHKTAIAKGTG